jgi:hypothetical protein
MILRVKVTDTAAFLLCAAALGNVTVCRNSRRIPASADEYGEKVKTHPFTRRLPNHQNRAMFGGNKSASTSN